jgi:hypothetical protein
MERMSSQFSNQYKIFKTNTLLIWIFLNINKIKLERIYVLKFFLIITDDEYIIHNWKSLYSNYYWILNTANKYFQGLNELFGHK